MTDRLIDEYLHELKVSAWIRQLPRTRTEALEDEVRERIETELNAAGNRDQGTVYRVLDRMGSPAEIVARADGSPDERDATDPVDASLARLRFAFASRGWGAAEIGGLLLLILGPFLLWWIGPIFGILLILYAARRWSPRSIKNASVIVFGLLGVQALAALTLLAYLFVTDGNIDQEWTRRLMSGFSPGQFLQLGSSDDGPLSLLRMVGALACPIAGITAGVYLAFSRRYREMKPFKPSPQRGQEIAPRRR